MSVGCYPSTTGCEEEIPENQSTKGKFPTTVFLKDEFGLAEHQQNATYGLRPCNELKIVTYTDSNYTPNVPQ